MNFKRAYKIRLKQNYKLVREFRNRFSKYYKCYGRFLDIRDIEKIVRIYRNNWRFKTENK